MCNRDDDDVDHADEEKYVNGDKYEGHEVEKKSKAIPS